MLYSLKLASPAVRSIPYACWELDLGSLEDKPGFLISKSVLQPFIILFKYQCSCCASPTLISLKHENLQFSFIIVHDLIGLEIQKIYWTSSLDNTATANT